MNTHKNYNKPFTTMEKINTFLSKWGPTIVVIGIIASITTSIAVNLFLPTYNNPETRYSESQTITDFAPAYKEEGYIDLDNSGRLIIEPLGLPTDKPNLYKSQSVALTLNPFVRELVANNGGRGVWWERGEGTYVFGDLGQDQHEIAIGKRKFLVRLNNITASTTSKASTDVIGYIYDFSILELE